MDIKNILKNAQKSKKRTHLSATISYDLKIKLDELAKINNVSLSMLVESILNEFLEATNSNNDNE